jgi:hypothetical protein
MSNSSSIIMRIQCQGMCLLESGLAMIGGGGGHTGREADLISFPLFFQTQENRLIKCFSVMKTQDQGSTVRIVPGYRLDI